MGEVYILQSGKLAGAKIRKPKISVIPKTQIEISPDLDDHLIDQLDELQELWEDSLTFSQVKKKIISILRHSQKPEQISEEITQISHGPPIETSIRDLTPGGVVPITESRNSESPSKSRERSRASEVKVTDEARSPEEDVLQEVKSSGAEDSTAELEPRMTESPEVGVSTSSTSEAQLPETRSSEVKPQVTRSPEDPGDGSCASEAVFIPEATTEEIQEEIETPMEKPRKPRKNKKKKVIRNSEDDDEQEVESTVIDDEGEEEKKPVRIVRKVKQSET